jgi:predicted phage terminase large subunit-like protein
MNPQLNANVRVARQTLRRTDLLEFTKRMYPGYQVGDIHRRIAEFLYRAETVPNFRGVLVVPPRFGKSELASVQFPSYYLGRHPDKEIIAASHTQDLTNHFSRRARRNVQSRAYYPFPEVSISGDAKAVEQWEVEAEGHRKRGRYQGVGVGGSPAGRGANVLLVDDPVKNAKSAESLVDRETAWEWFRRDMLTRLQPEASAVVIGTRWHWDDLIGRIIKSNQDEQRWEVLHFPALLPDGTSLDPERWPLPDLMERRKDVGERVWDALYQGVPTADEGAILKKNWFPFYMELPEGILYLIQSWDTAFKGGELNDYSVCHTYAVTVYGLFLVNRYKGQPDYPDLERKQESLYAQFKPKKVYIEDKGSGQSLIQSARKNPRHKMPIIPVPVPPGEGKIKRVHDATPILEGQRVYLPQWAPWADETLAEWTAFPLGIHDDEVDAMIQAVLREFGDPAVPQLQAKSYADPDRDPDTYPMRRD